MLVVEVVQNHRSVLDIIITSPATGEIVLIYTTRYAVEAKGPLHRSPENRPNFRF